jgi:predicted ATPase/DNA-binding SARP family transcriptional activator/Flp pilus assembly protein TadD
MTRLSLFLLGPPRIERAGVLIEFDTRKAIALLAYLAVTGESLTRDALATLLWPESAPARSRAALRSTLWALKKPLGGEWLNIGQETISLNRNADLWVDVCHFHSRLTECRTHGHPTDEACPVCLNPLTEAAALYRGDLLSGFTLRDSPSFDDWQAFQTESLRQEFISVVERLICYYSTQGEFKSAITFARRWLTLDPLHEPAHYHAMQLYAWAGQRTDALRQYQKCVQILKQELGVPPQVETTRLCQAIQENRGLLPPVNRTLHPLFTRPNNLPQQPTLLVGREKELAEIGRLLSDPACRLLTLVGPGGIGKTRLAIQAAAEKIETFSHGVYLVSLATQSSTDLVPSAIADSLKFFFHGEADPQSQLLDHLREKEMLLVLDNFEHLLEGTRLLVEILERAPGVKLLVTSRENLNLRWEWPFDVRGLSFPSNGETAAIEDYDAVQLFLRQARQNQRGLALSEVDKPFVARICQFLEGMPLGIELAATWVQVFSCREIAQKVESNLGFLATGLRDVPERHRSLQATFDHSWALLSKEERNVFYKLSIFRGGFGLEAAEKVAGASPFLLLALVRKSFLRRAGTGRYEMLEVVRQYAEEKLEASQDRDCTHDLRCEYYAEFLCQREEHLKGKRQKEALEEIGKEIENVRAGWQWGIEHGKQETVGKALTSLCLFYAMRGRFQEGEEMLEKAVERLKRAKPGEDSALLGRILAWRGSFCRDLAHLEKAGELLRESIAIFRRLGLRREMAFPLQVKGRIAAAQNEYTRAKQFYRASLTLYQEKGDREGIASSFYYQSRIAIWLGEYAKAKQMLQESLAIHREMGNPYNTAIVLDGLGLAALWLEEYDEAEQLFQESLTIFREIGDRWRIAMVFLNQGNVAFYREKYQEAQQLFQTSLATMREIGARWGIATALNNLGEVTSRQGEYAEAKHLFREVVAIYQEIGNKRKTADALCALGAIFCMLKEYQEARRHYCKALEISIEGHFIPAILQCLVGVAVILIKEGKGEWAAELVALVLHHSASERDTRKEAQRLFSELESQLAPNVLAHVQEWGKVRDIVEITEAILTYLQV